jgi:hypothetical protein
MRVPRFITIGARLAAAMALTAVMACTETPTEPPPDDAATMPAFANADKKLKPTFHYARVRSDGTLVSGTALSASRFNTGVYTLEFPPPIDECAASANSASFQGFDISVFRITAQIGIGQGEGGVFSDSGVVVSLFNTSDGSSEDSSFTLMLLCP